MNQHGEVILIEEIEYQINLPKFIRITGVLEYINYHLNLCLICGNNARVLINIEIVDLHAHSLGSFITIIGELKEENSQLLLYNYKQLLLQSSFPSFSNELSTDYSAINLTSDSQFIIEYLSHNQTIKLLHAQIVVNTTQVVNMDTSHTVIKKRREFLLQQEQMINKSNGCTSNDNNN